MTNGWAYILLLIGSLLRISWMIAISGAYMALLWFPFTPEKLITWMIAMVLLKRLFPNDRKTLGVLKSLHAQTKEKIEKYRDRKGRKKKNDRSDNDDSY